MELHPSHAREFFAIGLMSGTSLDGIDAALIRCGKSGGIEFLHGLYRPFSQTFREELSALVSGASVDREQVVRMDALLGHLLADAVEALLKDTDMVAKDIAVVGSHGLTMGHFPEPRQRFGHSCSSTWQIGDGDVVAERLGITVVSDFRKRDMAAGGEGAPLVPLLDRNLFGDETENRACLNIGGIANITVLPAGRLDNLTAFDTGPGNCLLDMAVRRLVDENLPHDPDGQYSEGGRPCPFLLDRLLSDPYLLRTPPKSTGREYFGETYLNHILESGRKLSFPDLLSTVAALTPASIVDAIDRFVAEADQPTRLIVSGGGVHNRYFMRMLSEKLPETTVVSSAAMSVDPDFKEAIAFGWLACRTLRGLPSSLPGVTGCNRPVILGKISPGLRLEPEMGD